jgi:LPS export ABC transporter protein LptC
MNLFKILNKSIIVLTIVLLFSCENKIEEINAIIDTQPKSYAKNITIYRTDSAKIIVKIFAKELTNINDEKNPLTEFPKGIDVTTYKNYPKPESSIKCNYAKNYDNEKIWIAQNDVVVINSDGVKLNTEELFWNTETKKIYTDKNVKITTKTEIILGEGMIADEDFKNYEIKKPKGSFYIEE